MKRSKNQAIYKYLPGMWISETAESSSRGKATTARIKAWNCIKMEGIYDKFIDDEIKRQVGAFGSRGGNISAFNIDNNKICFKIVEPACNEGIPDIVGEISPLVFYCANCHKVKAVSEPSKVTESTWKCTCNKNNQVKQLQMIYACECGMAAPMTVPYRKGVKEFFYRPNEAQFKFKYKSGNNEMNAEMYLQCPNCGTKILPDNAESNRNYKPFNLSIINLMDKRSGKFFEYGIDAQKVVVAQWFELMSYEEYEKILDNPEQAFSIDNQSAAKRAEAEKQVDVLIASGYINESVRESVILQMMGAQNQSLSAEKYILKCDEFFALRKSGEQGSYEAWISRLAFNLMQYNTIRHSNKIITLEESINRQLDLEFIQDKEQILNMNNKLGISLAQVSCDVEIVNCAYGYTRRVTDPKNSKTRNLKLVAFDKTKDGNANLVYAAKLNTEGLLFEIDRVRIINWLYKNGVLREEELPDLEDDECIKKWFAEHVHGEQVNNFSGADDTDKITNMVFSLLHSISHAMIKVAGEISGLASNSLSEIIFMETQSIFIYAQSSQGLPLGAISGMFENEYARFLQMLFDESKNCIFDPVCETRESVCTACLLLPEISCSHFNSNLGRKYLYSIDTHQDGIKHGFWEM